MEREHGNYRVNLFGDWYTATYYTYNHRWMIAGGRYQYKDSDFYEIDERQIECNNP